MELNHQLETYKGYYGDPDSNTLVYNKITIPEGPRPDSRDREIILVVDLSGSMAKDVPHLQASLTAFKDSLVELSESEADVNLRMIGYNDKAWEIYSPDLEGFTGVGNSVEDCLYKAKWGMEEHIALLKERGLPIPKRNSNPTVTIKNAKLAGVS